MDNSDRDNAGVIAPPPLIYLAGLGAGLALHWLRPIRLASNVPTRLIGLAIAGGGLLLGRIGIRHLHGAGTNVDPYMPVNAIVTSGPYRWTRNPLYVGLTLMYLGIAAIVNSLTMLLPLPIVLTIMRRGVIEREERYLERKFGDEYLQYKRRVRRWL